MEILAIDDLDIEPREVMDFGNVGYPVVDLLTKRYEDQLQGFSVLDSKIDTRNIKSRQSAYALTDSFFCLNGLKSGG